MIPEMFREFIWLNSAVYRVGSVFGLTSSRTNVNPISSFHCIRFDFKKVRVVNVSKTSMERFGKNDDSMSYVVSCRTEIAVTHIYHYSPSSLALETVQLWDGWVHGSVWSSSKLNGAYSKWVNILSSDGKTFRGHLREWQSYPPTRCCT